MDSEDEDDGGHGEDRDEDGTTVAEAMVAARRQSRVVKRALRSALPLANIPYPCVHLSKIEYPLGMALTYAMEKKAEGSWNEPVPALEGAGPHKNEEATLRSNIVHLLDAGACPNRPNLGEVTPFSMAVELGDIGLLKHMLQKGARPDLLLERESYDKLVQLCGAETVSEHTKAEWRLLSPAERIQAYTDAGTGVLHIKQDTETWSNGLRARHEHFKALRASITV